MTILLSSVKKRRTQEVASAAKRANSFISRANKFGKVTNVKIGWRIN
jgi:hypothetical protein